jgi:hypothetical protein
MLDFFLLAAKRCPVGPESYPVLRGASVAKGAPEATLDCPGAGTMRVGESTTKIEEGEGARSSSRLGRTGLRSDHVNRSLSPPGIGIPRMSPKLYILIVSLSACMWERAWTCMDGFQGMAPQSSMHDLEAHIIQSEPHSLDLLPE